MDYERLRRRFPWGQHATALYAGYVPNGRRTCFQFIISTLWHSDVCLGLAFIPTHGIFVSRFRFWHGKVTRTPVLVTEENRRVKSRLTNCTVGIDGSRKKKMPEGDSVRSPAFSRCAAKTELCVTRRISLSLDFFRCRGLHGMPSRFN
jgi:hypothetical protein